MLCPIQLVLQERAVSNVAGASKKTVSNAGVGLKKNNFIPSLCKSSYRVCPLTVYVLFMCMSPVRISLMFPFLMYLFVFPSPYISSHMSPFCRSLHLFYIPFPYMSPLDVSLFLYNCHVCVFPVSVYVFV